ncbi:MAG: helix-turn-helix transcriptional regulator [Deltaproteobacteria bacterium]|nr:helix-turn-helix transcriptional regulator [Deltaproteobacteria bacterium]MBI4223299.1 helix-turn-helix transcriptional regulator [Deltaproteobacteria bacterium]
MNTGIFVPLPPGVLGSPYAFGGYLGELNDAGQDPALAIDVLEGGLLAAGEGASELAQVADYYHQATSLEARRRFSDLIAGRLQHLDNNGPAQRALAFWRGHVRPPPRPFGPQARFRENFSELAAAAPSMLSAPAGRPARRPYLPLENVSASAIVPLLDSASPSAPPPEAPAALKILTAGWSQPPEILKQFPAYRSLTLKQQRRLRELWIAYNNFLLRYLADPDWWNDASPEYIKDPLALARDMAEAENLHRGLTPKTFKTLLQLHYEIRRDLSRLQVLDATASVQLDGFMPGSIRDVDTALLRFENVYGTIPDEERTWYLNALIRLEIARQRLTGQKRMSSARIINLTGKLFPDKSVRTRRHLQILHGLFTLVRTKKSGDAILADLPHRATLWNMVATAARVLSVPKYFLAASLGIYESEASENGTNQPAPLQGILSVFNLLAVQKPWEVLLKIFPDELNWAFRVKRLRNGLLVFEIANVPDLEQLSRGGFGSVLNAERVARGISWKELNGLLERRLGRRLHFSTLTRYGTNANHCPFEKLKALLEIFRALPPGRNVFPSDFLLSAHPAWIGLLPLYSAETGAMFSLPRRGPYREIAYPETRTHRINISPSQPTVEPMGFPALVRNRRITMGLDTDRAAKKLGLDKISVQRMEMDPRAKHRVPIPSQETLRYLADPRGYGLSVEKIIVTHQHTYWRENPLVQRLVRRTFNRPILINGHDSRKLQIYCRFPFSTPGEILFYWRKSLAVFGSPTHFHFPLTIEEMARLLGVKTRTYEGWENGKIFPGRKTVDRLTAKLGVSRKQKGNLKQAIGQMRSWLRENDATSQNNQAKNHRRGKARRA